MERAFVRSMSLGKLDLFAETHTVVTAEGEASVAPARGLLGIGFFHCPQLVVIDEAVSCRKQPL
jgi:hypothetical protein